MTELTKEYNNYLAQIEMLLHPNLFNAFMKIHNEILKAETEAAKSFKPSKEWVELKKTIDAMKGKEKDFKALYIKEIIKQIDILPPDTRW